MFKNVLIPTDGSALSRKAIKAGVTFAQSLGARITGYFAMEALQPYVFGDGYVLDRSTMDQLDRQARTMGEKYLGEISKAAAAAGVPFEGLITKPPTAYEGIIDAAKKKKCDAIFMASHGRGELKTLLLGSVTQKVLSHSKLPVIVFR
jgi:nucleotide-binding universal stress UspA family protein